MKTIWGLTRWVSMAWLAAASPGYAANNFPTPDGAMVPGEVLMCVNGSGYAVPCGTSGNPLVISGSFSASISGFRPTNYGTPIAVTSSGVTGTLPTNTGEVVATNSGTTQTAYCSLGASATTSAQPIAPNDGWFAFGISGDTQITCITATGTTTVNTAGGSGLPTGTGGGGGGSGSSGAVFGPTAAGIAAANPPVLCGGTVDGTATGAVKNCHVDVNLNLDIDAPSGSALLAAIQAPLASQLPTVNIGGVGINAQTAGGCTMYHLLSAASVNATLVSTGPHTLCGYHVHNTSATGADFRLYDSSAAPSTCGSADVANVKHNDPSQPNTTSAGYAIPIQPGIAFVNGLSFCLTSSGGYTSDIDTGNAPTGIVIDIEYK